MYNFYVTNPTINVNTNSFTLLHSDMFQLTSCHPQGVLIHSVSRINKIHVQMYRIIYNTLVFSIFLYGSENWTLTALQRWRIEAAEMKLLRPLAGYTFYDHKTNDYIRRELRITGILDKIDEYRRTDFHTCKECHKTESLLKSYRYRPQGRRTIGRPKKRWREQL